MRIMVLALIVVLGIPAFSNADKTNIRFAEVQKVGGGGHIFVYQCKATGNQFKVEQRYNSYSKSEEIRFIVNGNADEWITKGISPDIYRYFSSKACEVSTIKYASK